MNWINKVNALQLFHVMRFGTLILIGILLVKSGYRTEEIGAYEIFFFIANLISFFWVMGVNNALMAYFPSLPADQRKSLLFNVGLLLLVLGMASALLFFIFQNQIAALANLDNGMVRFPSYIMLYMILSAPGNFTEYYYLLQKKSKKIIGYGVVLFSIQLSLIILGVLNGAEIKGLIQLMVIWALIKFIWFWYEVIRMKGFRLDFKLQWIFLLFAFPLIVHMLVGNGMEYVDGFIINHFFDQATFAQFRYGARELPLVAVLVGSVSTALIPDAVNSMDDALKKVKTKITQLGNFLFPISISLMLLSSTIFPIIYSEDFAISAQIFNIYLLIITSRILMPQVVIFARHNNLILVISAIVELVVNVALSLVLLQYFGILGIAWATVIAFMVNKTILIVFAYTKHGIPLGKYLNIRHYFLWIFLLCISYLIAHYFL